MKTPIWIYDKEEALKLILNHNGDIPHTDSWHTEQLNGSNILEFTVPSNDPKVALIENDGRAVIRDQDGELVEFIIRQVHDINEGNGPEKRVMAEGGDYELIDEWMTGYVGDNVSLQTALQYVTQGTRLSVGSIDDFGTQSFTILPTTVKNAILQLLSIYSGGEVRYRVRSTGNNITERYIDVLKKRGQFSGKRFEMGKDIRTSEYTPDSTGIKTALYGYGASGENDGPRVTFEGIEWSIVNGDPADKPLGQAWIGDPDSLQKWGYDRGRRHRFGEYSGQEEDAGELLLNTWRELQKMNDIRRTYNFQVSVLQNIDGYSHEKVRLGDTVVAIDREVVPYIEVRASIIEYRKNLNDDDLDEVTLGQFRNALDTHGRVNDIGRVVDNKQGNWAKKETPEGAEEKAKNEAQTAIDFTQEKIDEAEAKIEEAKLEIAAAEGRIADAEIELGSLEDDLNSGNFKITEDTIITGTIGANQATILKGTFQEVTVIDANIQDATITGELVGVNGTFTGELVSVDGTFVGDLVGGRIYSDDVTFVGSNLYVTDTLYLGDPNGSGSRLLKFNNDSLIRSGYGIAGLHISSSDTSITDGNVYLGSGDYNVTVYSNLKIPNKNGLQFSSYGGGWYMQDLTWIRAYGGKNIYTPGTIKASTFDDTSSIEYKENIALYSDDAVNLIKNLPVYRYNYKKEYSPTNWRHRKTGFIIPEDKSEFPETLMGPSGDGVDIYAAISVLWRANQQLIKRLEMIENAG